MSHTDDMLRVLVDVAMTPTQMRRDMPVSRAEPVPGVCPCCREPHPADVGCKPLERSDNGYTLEYKP